MRLSVGRAGLNNFVDKGRSDAAPLCILGTVDWIRGGA